MPFHGLRVRPDAKLTSRVAAKADISRSIGPGAAPTASHALGRLMRAAGLDAARIATDDARTPAWLTEAGMTRVECIYDPAAFKEIRVVKSAAEIRRMRDSARANEQACRAVAARVKPGMGQRDLDRQFAVECAQLDSRATYLLSDLGELPHGHIVPGEPVMLDALSTRAGYYGDFGRTLIVGEISASCAGGRRACKPRGSPRGRQSVRIGL